MRVFCIIEDAGILGCGICGYSVFKLFGCGYSVKASINMRVFCIYRISPVCDILTVWNCHRITNGILYLYNTANGRVP